MRAKGTLVILALALTAGLAIGYVDSRPTWDDTGVTAGSIFLAAGLLAAIRPRVAWLVGLAVGLPVLACNVILRDGNFGSAVAIAIGLGGAGVGDLVGKATGSGETPQSV